MEAGPRDTARSGEPDSARGSSDRPPEPAGDPLGPGSRLGGARSDDGLTSDGPGSAHDTPDGEGLDGLDPLDTEEKVEVELRPQRRLRVWQLAPIVVLTAVGSLMFAFPLAFEFGDGGAVVAMLGLLICACAAGWGVMAARRAGSTWPGLPQRGSGRRPDWRVIVVYAVVVAAVVVLAVWRVARLR